MTKDESSNVSCVTLCSTLAESEISRLSTKVLAIKWSSEKKVPSCQEHLGKTWLFWSCHQLWKQNAVLVSKTYYLTDIVVGDLYCSGNDYASLMIDFSVFLLVESKYKWANSRHLQMKIHFPDIISPFVNNIYNNILYHFGQAQRL